jgi:hypothetical protein
MKYQTKLGLIFCSSALTISLIILLLIFPFAKLSPEAMKQMNTPKNIEEFDLSINMGADYGELPIIDLMGYYMENPPVINDNTSSKIPERQFGGC